MPAPTLMVTRIDAPTIPTARNLILNSVETSGRVCRGKL